MKKGIYSFIAVFIVLMSSCAPKLQSYDFSEEYATTLHYDEVTGDKPVVVVEEKSTMAGVPALNFYGGDLKRGGIWWAGKGISLEKGDVFIFDATDVGPDSIPFGATFPPLDLTTVEGMIKISARAGGKDSATAPTSAPVLYLELVDADGFKANAKKPFNKIENSEEFKDYYFDLKDVYMQSQPKHSVNGAFISSIKFYINPGQEAYSGLIYIREIKVVPAKSVVK
jgi:hypothetical protein